MPKKRSADEIEGINADLRKRFGATATRDQLLNYKTETGTFPVWVYRGERVGRGLYRIPAAPAALPIDDDDTETMTARPVLPTPFDNKRKSSSRPDGDMPQTFARVCTTLDHIYPNSMQGTKCYCGKRTWGGSK